VKAFSALLLAQVPCIILNGDLFYFPGSLPKNGRVDFVGVTSSNKV
jgi:hypothetical protein